MNKSILRLSCLLFFFVYGCAANNSTFQVTDDPKSIQFVQKMKVAATHEGWCKTYFGSFQQTKQDEYLQLSAGHCDEAVKIYGLLELQLADYTLERYDALMKRREVCAFYHRLAILAQDNLIKLLQYKNPICDR